MSTVLVMSLTPNRIDKHCHTIDDIVVISMERKVSTMPNLDIHSRRNYFVCINLESSQKCVYSTIIYILGRF